MVNQATLLELHKSPHSPAFCLTAFGGKDFLVEVSLLVLLHENILNSRNVSHVYWKLSNSHEILQICHFQYISFCVSLTSLLYHSIIYCSGLTALSLCRCDAERYLSPDNASPSHTGRNLSENILIKPLFNEKKKRGKAEDLVLLQCQCQSPVLPIHLYSRYQRQATFSLSEIPCFPVTFFSSNICTIHF